MQVGDIVAKRYRVERLIGRGGAAEVYEVTDVGNGERLALKRVGAPAAHAEYAELMLAREYNALVQLSHPLIIRALDYGRPQGAAYYTMELLSGESLRKISPLGWREACDLLRDVASALAIVHSRRLVHRDVTTRNICRVAGGHAKLLDFGALTPMGAVHDLVGTPPFVPPEALHEQRIDGRADLFALGAVAYFVLTGRHAFPARSFRELGDTWRLAVPPPSAAVRDVPPALDELILSLLSLAQTARPQSAAEVFQRLTAIADLPTTEQPEVAQAYLSTPSLVGRERALERGRKSMARLERGKGSALLIEGHSGLGRTRLLGTFLLEAKLRGVLTVRAGGRDAKSASFGLIRTLVRELSAADSALFDAASGNDADFLRAPCVESPAVEEENWQKDALRFVDFFTQVARTTPFVLAADDIDAADARSLATLALLAKRGRRSPILLLFTAQGAARGLAMRALRRSTTSVELAPFTEAETRVLISTLFGNAPRVEGVAEWMHRLTDGNPRGSLELSQHLVDRGVATYHEGAWALPASMAGLGLPETIDQALEARLRALQPAARELAQVLSLMTEHDPLLITDYPLLTGNGKLASLFEALNELIADSILVSAGSTYVFSHRELADVARRTVPEEALPSLHRRLAHAYASGSGRGTILVVYHLHHAGDHAAAFRAAVDAVSQRTMQSTGGAGLVRSREGAQITESLFLWGTANAMPRRDLALLGRSLLQLASVVKLELVKHAPLVLEPLRRESGLVYWAEMAEISDPRTRMQACLARAYAAHEATPESERGLDPGQAIAELATTASSLIGVYTREFDIEGAVQVGELLHPLRTMAPAVDVIAQLVELAERGIRGLYILEERARAYERLSHPIPGIDDVTREGTRHVALYYRTLELASYGHDKAAEHIAPLDDYPHFVPLAWQVRMVAHLFLGEAEEAVEARRRRDAASIGRTDIDRHLDLGVIYEGSVSSMLGDLLSLERSISVMAERAHRSPGWAPYHHAFKGNHHALRGDLGKALEEHRRAAALVPRPGVNAAWAYAINCLASTLIELERPDEAEARLEQALRDCETVPLIPHVRFQFEMNLALARAALGRHEAATQLAARAVERMIAFGTKGVILLEHYAKQAMVALRARDLATFQATVGSIEAMPGFTKSPAFAAKHEYLLRQARTVPGFSVVPPPPDVTVAKDSPTIAHGLRGVLQDCQGADERATRALDVLLEWSGTDGGFLYLYGSTRLTLVAATPGLTPPESLEEAVNDWLRTFVTGDPVTRSSAPGQSDSAETALYETVGLVGHREDGARIAGVAALSRTRTRRAFVPQSVLDALGDGLLAAGDAVGRRFEM